MKSIKFYKTLALIFILIAFFIPAAVSAAVLYVTSEKTGFNVGDKFTANVRIDGEGMGINAAQATVQYSNDVLEVVNTEKTGSIFEFWLREPEFSNDTGRLVFVGGATSGFSGKALQVLKINFRVKGGGSANITLTDAAVTASDGSGTNVLSTLRGIQITAASKTEEPAAAPIPPPQQITRPAVPSAKLPVKPAIEVPLYPNQDRWYNIPAVFFASWQLPPDVIKVAAALNKNPIAAPEKSEGLFDNKTFESLQDGIWYLHVRFQNNLGWGPAAHYRLAVDTQPPLGFEIGILEGETTDNPTPIIQFNTSDALSGLKEYLVRIGDSDLIPIIPADFAGSFKLPLQGPGKRQIIVKAVDQADNGIENSLDIEILPIASPVITFTPRELFSEDEQGLAVKGTALPNINVLLKIQKVLRKGRGEIVGNSIVRSDDKGNWEFTFGELPLRNGRYVVLAQSQDARGALSLIVESPEVRVKSKPIIQIGPFQLGKGSAALLLLLILIAGFGGGIWFYKKRQEKLTMRVAFTESEITKIFQFLKQDIDQLRKSLQTPTTGDDEYALKRLQENIQKMEAYLKRGVEKLKK